MDALTVSRAKPRRTKKPTVELPALVEGARRTLAHALFEAVGQPGSLVEHPGGLSFQVSQGAVTTGKHLVVALPGPHRTTHFADIHAERDDGRWLVVDILGSASDPARLKAAAYDATYLRARRNGCFLALVVVEEVRSRFTREEADAVGHPYDLTFGVPADDVHLSRAYAALVTDLRRFFS